MFIGYPIFLGNRVIKINSPIYQKVCLSLFLDNFSWNWVIFSIHLHRKWVSEWVGERYHQLDLKSLGILSVCFALFLDKFTLSGVLSSIYLHRNWWYKYESLVKVDTYQKSYHQNILIILWICFKIIVFQNECQSGWKIGIIN